MSDRESSRPQIDWDMLAKMDSTVRPMMRAGTPMTRANYIDAKQGAPDGDDFPDEWTFQHEMDIPAAFEGTDEPEAPLASTPFDSSAPETQQQLRSSPLLQFMAAAGVPLTRENYIDMNWPDGFGDEGWGWEHEEQLPRPFQIDREPDDD